MTCCAQLYLDSLPDQASANPPKPHAGGLGNLALQTSDVMYAFTALKSRGASLMGDVQVNDATGKRFFVVEDPNGIRIELHEGYDLNEQ